MLTIALSFLAGILTCLSPCVLPIIPIIVGSSLQKNKFGPLAIALGLILSFTGLGILLMIFGLASGLSPSLVRQLASILLIFAGLTLVSTSLQNFLMKLLSPISNHASFLLNSKNKSGLLGQFTIGLLLGALWSPCTGPTLGAVTALGAKNGPSLSIVLSLLFFGLGNSLPLLVIAYGGRKVFVKNREQISKGSKNAKFIFGIFAIIVGLTILFGLDKQMEALILNYLPESVINLSVKF